MYILDTEMAIAKSQAISWLLCVFQECGFHQSTQKQSMVLEKFCTNQWICLIEFHLRHQIFERYTDFSLSLLVASKLDIHAEMYIVHLIIVHVHIVSSCTK